MSARSKFPRHRPLRALGAKLHGDGRSRASSRAPGEAGPERTKAPTSFAHVAAATGVVPLAGGSLRVPLPSRIAAPRTTRRREFEVSADDGFVDGARRGLAAHVRAALRGTPRATLDLHGLRVAVAERRLLAFIAMQRAAGAELVLVIVGKGRHSPGGAGVLRGAITEWLTTGPAAAHVLAFRTAPPALGGNGGVLVLLERRNAR
ncbi:MAG TPA: Smr/MutS family protein [Polyangiaceae bacterium]|nr:Smr/MutS family protein [Polyangiaceae bacterium]